MKPFFYFLLLGSLLSLCFLQIIEASDVSDLIVYGKIIGHRIKKKTHTFLPVNYEPYAIVELPISFALSTGIVRNPTCLVRASKYSYGTLGGFFGYSHFDARTVLNSKFKLGFGINVRVFKDLFPLSEDKFSKPLHNVCERVEDVGKESNEEPNNLLVFNSSSAPSFITQKNAPIINLSQLNNYESSNFLVPIVIAGIALTVLVIIICFKILNKIKRDEFQNQYTEL